MRIGWIQPIRTLHDGLLDILFPKVCDLCGQNFDEGLSNVLCSRCFKSIQPFAEPVCSHCGESLPPGAFEGASSIRCSDCGNGEYFLNQVRAYGKYEGALRIAHHCFKFEGMEKLGLDIADRMAGLVPEGVENEGVVLCPVPLSPERERERGYNPASILSLRIAKLKNLHHRTLLQKVKSVPPQMSLTKELRLRNPLGAYQLSKPGALPYRILLVDDVFTTGATLEECAKVLKGSGTQWVGALVWGRTPRYF